MNLPTPLEAHKTLDNKIFLKAADIGQILQVFKKEKERETMKSRICKTPYGDYAPSGITPPTQDIVKRRFEFTRMNEDTFIPYQIRQITDEITSFGSSATASSESKALTTTKSKRSKESKKEQQQQDKEKGGGEDSRQEQRKIERVIEEVVDFEEWMVDPTNPMRGRTIVLDGLDWSTPDAALLLMHPELLMTEEDREEDELEELTQQQLRNKANKQQQQQQQSSSSSSANGGPRGEEKGEVLTALSSRQLEGVEGEGGESRMKLSFTFKRTPSTGSRTGDAIDVGDGVAADAGEETMLGEGQEEEKYQLEAEGENMELDDAAIVADDVEEEQNDPDDEEDDDLDDEDDEHLADLILEKSKQKASQSALGEGEGEESMAMVAEEGDEAGDLAMESEQVGMNMDDQGDDDFGVPRHHPPAQFQAGDEDSDDEDWMKGV